MDESTKRRDLLKLMSLGGVVFASSLFGATSGCASGDKSSPNASGTGPKPGTVRGADKDFFFLQVSDVHWGFSGDAVNPDAALELPKVVAAINASATAPDFVVFTGDLTHNTDDVNVRRQRMSEFRDITAALTLPVWLLPGEHDAAADAGEAYREFFGETHYSFDHQGVHFVALDNVSDPMANIGADQLSWLADDLGPLDAESPIVVFTHRPLWDLRPDWDWATPDGQKAIDILTPYHNVVVFFGHIHQELHHMTGHIAHHAARSIQFALPSPDSTGARQPIAWDPTQPEAGLGYRSVEATPTSQDYALTELALAPGGS
jgi:hypothetical protein